MALRDQPYLPLYVQDFITDEKLNMCSASSQGVYIKIMCVLHKQEDYGTLLIKQKDKQKDSQELNFASVLSKLLPFDEQTILNAIIELTEENVLTISGDKIFQKRMVKDGKTSLERSKAGKRGGGNPILFKQRNKQTDKQNTEYENEYEYEIKSENKKEKKDQKTIFDFSFLAPEFKGIFERWITYKIGIKDNYKTQDSIQQAYKNLLKLSGNNTDVAEEIINYSIGNGYKGLFASKNTTPTNGKATKTIGINAKISGNGFFD